MPTEVFSSLQMLLVTRIFFIYLLYANPLKGPYLKRHNHLRRKTQYHLFKNKSGALTLVLVIKSIPKLQSRLTFFLMNFISNHSNVYHIVHVCQRRFDGHIVNFITLVIPTVLLQGRMSEQIQIPHMLRWPLNQPDSLLQKAHCPHCGH